jgi:hypothetical protein
MSGLDTRQCLRCGAVTADIHSAHRKVHVDVKQAFIYPNPMGKDFGYTPSGRLIRGDLVIGTPKYSAYQVHLEHKCGVR